MERENQGGEVQTGPGQGVSSKEGCLELFSRREVQKGQNLPHMPQNFFYGLDGYTSAF